MAARDIRFRPKTLVEALAPGRVATSDGHATDADLVIVVPPHRPPPVVKESGLTGQGDWVRVDPPTLRTEHERVFAVGDVVEMATGAGLPFPKAGIFAERHAEVVARNIAAIVGGGAPDGAFDGSGYCFLEVGEGLASLVTGNFFASPSEVRIAEPAPQHLEAKYAFERERLERWFGET